VSGEPFVDSVSYSTGDPQTRTARTDPAELRGRLAQAPFVGRDREMSQGLAILDDVQAGRGRLLLLAGEPGIGKTRMADELSARAEERGVQVVWGRCWEAGGAPAYWPWVQSLRTLIRALDAQTIEAQLGPGAADIAQLLPEIRATLAHLPPLPTLDPEAARFRLFDAVTSFLKKMATSRPVMVILDDLQVADTPSLLLLRFVARQLGSDRILVVGTYRDIDLDADHALATTLLELTREQAVHRVTLRGLAAADAARFINAAAGVTPQANLVRRVLDETEGNPLFLGEFVRLLQDEGRLHDGPSDAGPRLAMPRSMREVIGRRLTPLSRGCVQTLTLASVLGREFNLVALSRLAETSLDDILQSLDEAFVARVITDVPGSKGRLRFSHVLIRESLHDAIARARLMQLHDRAGHVLEALYEDDPEPHLAELAHHFFEGAPSGDVEKAVMYARRAGDNAVSLLAYEEAVRLYQMALQVLELTHRKSREEQCEVMLALGDAQSRAGDEAGSKLTFLHAADLSRSLGLGNHLARAALGYGGRGVVWERAGGDPHIIPLLQDALAAIGDGDSVLEARMLARLAGAMRDDPSPEPRESLSKRAVDVARRLQDPATLAFTLEGMFGALWKPDTAHERLAIASEQIAAGQEARDSERVLSGHMLRACAFLELGDTSSMDKEFDAMDRIADELREPAKMWLAAAWRCLLALFQGRFDDAELLVSAAFHVGERSYRSYAVAADTLYLFQLRKEQGRLAEMEEQISDAARLITWYPMFRCALANLHCELDQKDQARAELEAMAVGDFAFLPRDNEWLLGMSLLSEVVCSLGDADRATCLYQQLLPYAELNAFGAIEGCTGSVSRYLGLLAAVMSRLDDAARHLEWAIAQNERMGARPWVAHTQHDFAVMLMTRHAPGDTERAIDLLTAALRTCDGLGMPALGEKVTVALGRPTVTTSPAEMNATTVAAVAPPTSVCEPSRAAAAERVAAEDGTFRREGEYWSIGYEGRVLRLRDSKGMRVLAQLLAHPGRPHASLDLERLGATGDEATARAVASSDAGELLDDDARRAYRARLSELGQTIEDAETLGNADRVGPMREEMDFITRELGRALGLGGRSRQAGSIAERARLNVTRAVKSAMQRIASADGGLASHLEATVHTGMVCVYSPDPRSPVGWRVSLGDVHKH
jgi:tetratricopeptide (TPR) repeat protein